MNGISLLKANIILISSIFLACEKVPEELLAGTWDGLNTDKTLTFGTDMSYSWYLPYHGLDPNTAIGTYRFSGDTLIVEYCYIDCHVAKYFWEVDEWTL